MNNFLEVLARARKHPWQAKIALIAPDEASMDAAEAAYDQALANSYLFFTEDTEEILLTRADDIGFEYKVAKDAKEAAELAVKETAAGNCQMLMKGCVDTATVLRAVLQKDAGLRTGKLLTHLAWLDIPTYHKLFIVTDGGMIPYPSLEEKAEILKHAVNYSHILGIDEPKVAVLAATEKVNPKMKETTDAASLKEQAEGGAFGKCIVEGPISFDLAYVPKAAELKGYSSPVAGDADIFLTPDLTSGNLMAKSLIFGGGGQMAGLIVGARVPVLVNSRSATAQEKLNSIAMAAIIAHETK